MAKKDQREQKATKQELKLVVKAEAGTYYPEEKRCVLNDSLAPDLVVQLIQELTDCYTQIKQLKAELDQVKAERDGYLKQLSTSSSEE
jgi:uncharacterized coiled-coil DUF342 family protein